MRRLLVLFSLLCAACSSIEKVTHYRVEQPKSGPGWTYRATTSRQVPTSASGFPAKLIYRKKWRLFQDSFYQYAEIEFASYGHQNITQGPLLLPLIPTFSLGGVERKIDLDTKLSFTLRFVSDQEIESVTARLPVLEIMTDRGQRLEPRVDVVSANVTRFTYDVMIRDLPWFVVREAEIKLSSGRALTIPETKFKLGKSIALNLLIPISP